MCMWKWQLPNVGHLCKTSTLLWVSASGAPRSCICFREKEHTETSRQKKRDEHDVQKVARVEAAQDVAKEVRARVLSGGDWSREFNADQIKTAANIILQPAQKFKTQPPAIAALTAWAATQTQAAPQGLAPQ